MLRKLQFLWEKKPTYLIFWVAQKCNFTCDHCFNHEENKKNVRELDLSEVQRIADSFGEIKYLTLAGGEPFINRDMAQIAEIFIKTNHLQHLNIITNGWYFDRIMSFCDFISEHYPNVYTTLNLSLDGPKPVHDKIRQKVGSFDRCIEVIQALKARRYTNITVAVNGVYNQANAATIEQFAHQIIDDYQIPFAINLVRGETIQNEALRAIEIDHYLKVARAILVKNKQLIAGKGVAFEDLINGVQSVVLDIIEASVKQQKRLAPCQAGKKGIVLTASGDIILCEILGTRLGNIRDYDYDIMKVLGTSESKSEIEQIERTKCHCTWECFQSLNTVYAPKLYPKVIKESF